VVTKDIRPYAIAVGNPAHQIGTRFPSETIREHEDALALVGADEMR
jgi:acetyltransferase-like isoleucine patch superfamily enzyme